MSKDYNDSFVLLQALNRRDLDAFDFLYTTYRKKLLLSAVYILKDEETAKDLVHEFFLEFWDNRLYEKINANVGAYMSQSIRNRAINLKKKAENFVTQLSGDYSEILPSTTYPLENEELRTLLNAAMNNLPHMSRKVFFLHYVERLTYNQIAGKLGIKNSTIKNHISRALSELRSQLEKTLKNS